MPRHTAPVVFTIIILAALLGTRATAGGRAVAASRTAAANRAAAASQAETSSATMQMAGVGEIALIDSEGYNLSIAEALEQVREQPRAQIISVALVEVRKKYPQLKLDDIALRDFSYRTARDGKAAGSDFTQGSIVVYFKDRAADSLAKRHNRGCLHWERLYRVEFVFTKGHEAVYVQMSPPPSLGEGGVLRELGDQGGGRTAYPPRSSRSAVPHG